MEDSTRKTQKSTMDSRERAIVPMTISMAKEYCNKEEKNIDGQPFESVKILGRLIDHTSTPSKHIFTVTDDTGTMQVIQTTLHSPYLEEVSFSPLNKYLKFIVTPKLTGDNHDDLVFYCNRIEECANMDGLICHLNEVMFRYLQRRHGFTF